MSKAFDCVPHDFSKNAQDLIQSYVNHRYRICSQKGNQSGKKIIKMGVPQGSILEPLLFLIFINDLPDLPYADNKTKYVLYADDTSLIVSDKYRLSLNHEKRNLKLRTMVSSK